MKIEGHLRVCGDDELKIFSLLQMVSKIYEFRAKLGNEVSAKIQNKSKKSIMRNLG